MMIHADEESVKSLDDGSLLDLIQSNKFFGIIWVFNDMSLCLWMPEKGRTWAQLPTRRVPNLHWQYQNFIRSNSSSELNYTHRWYDFEDTCLDCIFPQIVFGVVFPTKIVYPHRHLNVQVIWKCLFYLIYTPNVRDWR